MSRDNLGDEQTKVFHNCFNKDSRFNLIITSHIQKLGYINQKAKINKLSTQSFPEHETLFRNRTRQQ